MWNCFFQLFDKINIETSTEVSSNFVESNQRSFTNRISGIDSDNYKWERLKSFKLMSFFNVLGLKVMKMTHIILEKCLIIDISNGEHGNIHTFVSRGILEPKNSEKGKKRIFDDLGNYSWICAHTFCVRRLIFPLLLLVSWFNLHSKGWIPSIILTGGRAPQRWDMKKSQKWLGKISYKVALNNLNPRYMAWLGWLKSLQVWWLFRVHSLP